MLKKGMGSHLHMSPISPPGPDILMWDTSEERVFRLLTGERQAKCKKKEVILASGAVV